MNPATSTATSPPSVQVHLPQVPLSSTAQPRLHQVPLATTMPSTPGTTRALLLMQLHPLLLLQTPAPATTSDSTSQPPRPAQETPLIPSSVIPSCSNEPGKLA